ncbi:MAG: ornithine carbamoyltransferase [Deltaproteobacteria bacterium]|nr:ornithine carbamoyltransferase [Deltaproteobacteria bacterium]
MRNVKNKILTLSDLGAKSLEAVIARAVVLKKGKKPKPVLKGKVLGLIFEKESTRTRVSFEVAALRLGGNAVYLGSNSSQLSRGETHADTARVLSRYLDALVLRGNKHRDLEEMARHAEVPVINGLTDSFHPCQVMADLMTISEKRGDVKKLKIAYIGDGNNMANTWIEAAFLLPFSLAVASPKNFWPDPALLQRAAGNSRIRMTDSPEEAVSGADVVNTDTWFSMGQEVSPAKRQAFAGFQVNSSLLKKAANKAMVLHCLPAHRGEEITDEVIDGPQSAVFDQAENRLWVQMALLEMIL